MEGTHDDDELSFLHIAAATANVVRWLIEKKQIDGDDCANDGERTTETEQRKKQSAQFKVGG